MEGLLRRYWRTIGEYFTLTHEIWYTGVTVSRGRAILTEIGLHSRRKNRLLASMGRYTNIVNGTITGGKWHSCTLAVLN